MADSDDSDDDSDTDPDIIIPYLNRFRESYESSLEIYTSRLDKLELSDALKCTNELFAVAIDNYTKEHNGFAHNTAIDLSGVHNVRREFDLLLDGSHRREGSAQTLRDQSSYRWQSGQHSTDQSSAQSQQSVYGQHSTDQSLSHSQHSTNGQHSAYGQHSNDGQHWTNGQHSTNQSSSHSQQSVYGQHSTDQSSSQSPHWTNGQHSAYGQPLAYGQHSADSHHSYDSSQSSSQSPYCSHNWSQSHPNATQTSAEGSVLQTDCRQTSDCFPTDEKLAKVLRLMSAIESEICLAMRAIYWSYESLLSSLIQIEYRLSVIISMFHHMTDVEPVAFLPSLPYMQNVPDLIGYINSLYEQELDVSLKDESNSVRMQAIVSQFRAMHRRIRDAMDGLHALSCIIMEKKTEVIDRVHTFYKKAEQIFFSEPSFMFPTKDTTARCLWAESALVFDGESPLTDYYTRHRQ